jgi:hypothetical protein
VAEVDPVAIDPEPASPADEAPASVVDAPADLDRDPEPADRLERLRRDAHQARLVAANAVRRTERQIDAGRSGDARNSAASAGILLDKAARLEELIQAEEDRRVRISEAQGELIVAVVEHYFAAVGLPLGDASRRALQRLLERADRGDVLAVDPADAEAAAGELRARVAGDGTEELRGLPVPADAGELVEGEVVDVGGARG